MLRPPSNPAAMPAPSPPPRLPKLQTGLAFLLPSERAALGLRSPTSPSHDSPYSSRIDTPPPLPPSPQTPLPRDTSRNDLFSVNWSPVTPNVSSRAASPTPLPKLYIPPASPTTGFSVTLPPSPPADVPTPSQMRSPWSDSDLPVTPTSPPLKSHWPTIAKDRWLDPRESPTLRLSSTKEFQLGEGRHASVYLASYLHPSATAWELCAAKRALSDRESQVASLDEAAVLARLGGVNCHPNIIKLLAVKDERDPGIEPVPAGTLSRHSSITSRPSQTPTSRVLPLPFSASGPFLSPTIGSPSLGSSETLLGAFEAPVGSRERVRRAKSRARYSEIPTPGSMLEPDMGKSSMEEEKSPRLVLALEYCPFGHSLSFAKSHPEQMGKDRWMKWAIQLVGAVAWVHERGVLHNDIKPHNVLVASDLSLRLSDFGMGLIVPSTPPTDPLGLGTPSYSSPEFVRPAPSPFSYPSDIFSLGVTLSVLLSGHEPFEGMRAVERMFKVAQGGYYDWEERRRMGEIGGESDFGGSHPPSRAGSLKGHSGSNQLSGTKGVSRQGSLRNGISGRSGRSRAESIGEGEREGMTAWSRDTLVARLLVGGDGTSPRRPSFSIPMSPKAGELEDEEEEGGARLGVEDAFPSPSSSFEYGHGQQLSSSSYSDGSPHQFFLDGEDVVPSQIRELLRHMTSPSERERPTAIQVLRSLESMEL